MHIVFFRWKFQYRTVSWCFCWFAGCLFHSYSCCFNISSDDHLSTNQKFAYFPHVWISGYLKYTPICIYVMFFIKKDMFAYTLHIVRFCTVSKKMTTYLIINCFKMQMNETEITGQLCYPNPWTDRVKIYPAHKTIQSKCHTYKNAKEFIHTEMKHKNKFSNTQRVSYFIDRFLPFFLFAIILYCLSLIYLFLLPLCYLQTLLILRSHSFLCRSVV